jgi:hypothetical protein
MVDSKEAHQMREGELRMSKKDRERMVVMGEEEVRGFEPRGSG